MKRGGWLNRSAPLPRGTGLRRYTRLRPRSKQRARDYRDKRVPLVRDLLEEYPVCQRCSAARSTDVHEPKTRARGGDPLDPAQCVALCRDCHDWVHANPAAATAEGWMKNSWDAA